MANEIVLSMSLSVRKGGVMDGLALKDLLVTWAGTKFTHLRQEVPTAGEALNLGEVSPAGGLCMIVNRDTANYVIILPGSGIAGLIRILPGHGALFGIHAAAPFVQANVAAVQIEVFLLEP